MNPISSILRDLRCKLGLRQFELAELLGYEQSYVSAIELGIKGPPSRDYVNSLIKELKLDDEAQCKLWTALELSQKKIELPNEAPENVFILCNELRLQLDKLRPAQIELINLALRLPAELAVETMPAQQRIKRRDLARKEATAK